MSGGWPPARPAPPLTLDRLHRRLGDSTMLGRRRPPVRRDSAADSVRRELLGSSAIYIVPVTGRLRRHQRHLCFRTYI